MKDFDSRSGELKTLLERHHPGVRCHVSVAERTPHLYECRRFNVRLDVIYPRGVFVVNREHDEDPGAALREAFDAAEQQLDALSA